MSDFSERKINEAVCIDTKRIYDSCVSKDCLEDLRVTFFGASQLLIDEATSIKCRDCNITAVGIDVEEVPFNRGYYSVNIKFYFRLCFDTYCAPCTPPRIAIGYAVFEKKCILYGSEGDVKIFTSSIINEKLDCPEAPQYTNPTAKVQAVNPVVLACDIVRCCDCSHPCHTSFPKSVLNDIDDRSIPDNPSKAVLVSLGLFSIVQMERDVQMLIPAYDFCIPDKECSCSTQNPCQTFKGIDFPVDEFFPPERPHCECNSCENKNDE